MKAALKGMNAVLQPTLSWGGVYGVLRGLEGLSKYVNSGSFGEAALTLQVGLSHEGHDVSLAGLRCGAKRGFSKASTAILKPTAGPKTSSLFRVRGKRPGQNGR